MFYDAKISGRARYHHGVDHCKLTALTYSLEAVGITVGDLCQGTTWEWDESPFIQTKTVPQSLLLQNDTIRWSMRFTIDIPAGADDAADRLDDAERIIDRLLNNVGSLRTDWDFDVDFWKWPERGVISDDEAQRMAV
jgi:hypothetical protein